MLLRSLSLQVERHASHTKSAAVLRIAAGLQAPLPLVSAALDFTFPQFFKDAVYDQASLPCGGDERAGDGTGSCGWCLPAAPLATRAVPCCNANRVLLASAPLLTVPPTAPRPPQIADNRYSLFGRTSACRLSDPRFEERFVS